MSDDITVVIEAADMIASRIDPRTLEALRALELTIRE